MSCRLGSKSVNNPLDVSGNEIEHGAAFFPNGQTALAGLRQPAERVVVGIDIDDVAATLIDLGNDLIGQIGCPGGADHYQQRRVACGRQAAVETKKGFIIAFVEPENVRAQQGFAAGAAQSSPFGIGDVFVLALGGDKPGSPPSSSLGAP
jgi:hypothetical protein